MRTLAALAIIASLATSASAKPHRAARKHTTAASQWMRDCIHERTGPDGGIPVAEARRICAAEQPDDLVAAAKGALALARANAKVAKARAKVAAAIEACEQAVVDRCVATAPDHDSRSCEDADLRGEFNVVCLAQEGK